jgi:hypothetical protein
MIADPDWDYDPTENVSLIGPLPKCYLLLLLHDMANFANTAAPRIIEIGHRPPRPIHSAMLRMDFWR